MAEPLDTFVKSFLTPLAAGGAVMIDGLLGPGALDAMVSGPKGHAMELCDGKVMADCVGAARLELCRFGPTTEFVTLTPDVIGLGIVWHNLLAMTHPEATTRGGLRKKVHQWSAEMLDWVGTPKTAQEVALRHAIFGRLGEVGRVDTKVNFWAGEALYIGVAPPSRLVAFKNLRRVEEQKTRQTVFDLLQLLSHGLDEQDLLPSAARALQYSPLTDLLLADRPEGVIAFRWTPSLLSMLTDAPLRGAAIRVALRAGARGAEAVTKHLQILERATARALLEGVPPAAAGVLLLFHLELFISEALARGAPLAELPLTWELIGALGTRRAAQLCQLEEETFVAALSSTNRAIRPTPNGPAAALVHRAGVLEIAS